MTREEAIKEIKNMAKFNYTLAPTEVFDMAIKALEQEPKTGHWKKTGFIDKVICDVCNKRVWDTFTDGVLNFQYCPNCGAKMLPTDSEKER